MTSLRAAIAMSIVAGSMAFSSTAINAQEGFEFMPDGGKTLALQLFAPKVLAKVSEASKNGDEWLAYLHDLPSELTEAQAQTLSDYLALNTPLPEGAFAKASEAGDVAAAFPPDGKELAIANCQFCHSFFSGYLMQDRDLQGWRNVFVPPFHKEIDMTDTERETFARYSATNMPLKYDDVPPELRF